MRFVSVSARQIASIVGSSISMGPGVGSLTQLFMRQMYGFIEQSKTWDGRLELDQGTCDERSRNQGESRSHKNSLLRR